MSNISGTVKNSATPALGLRFGLVDTLKRGMVGGLLSVVGNLVVFLLARYAFSLELLMPPIPPSTEPAQLEIAPVVIASFIPALGAAVVYWLLSRFTAKGRLIFLVVSAVFLLLSFVGPLALPVATSTQLTLSLMHIVSAAAIVGALVRK